MLVWEFNQRLAGLDDKRKFKRLQTAKIQHAGYAGFVEDLPSVWELAGVDKPKGADRTMSHEDIEADIKRKERALQQAKNKES